MSISCRHLDIMLQSISDDYCKDEYTLMYILHHLEHKKNHSIYCYRLINTCLNVMLQFRLPYSMHCKLITGPVQEQTESIHKVTSHLEKLLSYYYYYSPSLSY